MTNVESLTTKLDQIELSLVATKTINDGLMNCVISLNRSFHALEQYRKRECLETIRISSSVDNQDLQSTICNILEEINVACGPGDIEDCHRIKGDCKSLEVLGKKEELKNIDNRIDNLNARARLYINESCFTYYIGLWGNGKGL